MFNKVNLAKSSSTKTPEEATISKEQKQSFFVMHLYEEVLEVSLVIPPAVCKTIHKS